MGIHFTVSRKLILRLSGNTICNQITSALLHFRYSSFYSNTFVVPPEGSNVANQHRVSCSTCFYL